MRKVANITAPTAAHRVLTRFLRANQGLNIDDIEIGDKCKTLVYGKMTDVVVLDIKPRGESRPWARSSKEAIKVRPVHLHDESFQTRPANELFPL